MKDIYKAVEKKMKKTKVKKRNTVRKQLTSFFKNNRITPKNAYVRITELRNIIRV